MDSLRRLLLLVPLAPMVLPNCTPDFDALSSGVASTAGTPSGGNAGNGSGSANGGSEPRAGSSGAGSVQGGGGGDFSGGGSAGGTPTTAGSGGASGDAGAGDAGAENMLAGAAGEGGAAPTCKDWPDVVTIFNGFDQGLEGDGFSSVSSRGTVSTTKGATASSGWDAKEGATCPGALRFSYFFKAYASGSDPTETGYGTYEFSPTSWTSGTALHVKVKVSEANAPITGVRFFIISSDKYLYTSVFDDTAFKSGGWNEMVIPAVANEWYDPTGVRQLGIEIQLDRADTPDIPAQPPQVLKVWLDDIWLEPN